jgi:FMN phosphatase YigB (HAD superfamily)
MEGRVVVSVLVCDLGKVLLGFDHEPCWHAILAECDAGEAARRAFHEVFVESGLAVGRTDGPSFFARVAPRMGLRMDYPAFCRAWSDMFWEDEEVIDLVRAARVEQRVLLSNTNVIHWEWITGRYPNVLGLFDRVFASHECGLEKPDPAIFRLVERASGRPAGAHLFVDDLRENVDGALAAGWDAIHYTDAAALRTALAARGLV